MTGSEKIIRVTLIDDSEDDILLMRKALEVSPPLEIQEVFKSSVGVTEKLMQQYDTRSLPDLIFLDINMPCLNGFEILRSLKENPGLRSIPTILITTSNREEDIEKAYALGGTSFIQKPFDFDDLVSLTRKVADYWSSMYLPKGSVKQ